MAVSLSVPVPPVRQERTQRLPFQCSTSVCPTKLEQPHPTAQASDADSALTLAKALSPGLGLATRAQLVPFQCRTRVCVPTPPTAHASRPEIALTPDRPMSPPDTCPGTWVQRLPSQCRIRTLPVRPEK